MALIKKFLLLFCVTSLSAVAAQQSQQVPQPQHEQQQQQLTPPSSSTTTTTSPCTDRCENGGICVFGGRSFQEGQEQLEDYRCACQPGWTGPTCNERFDTCSESSPCQNNGVCVLGLRDDHNNEQYFCSCSSATDEEGNSYVGKFCEHRAVQYCDGSGNFCVNGSCNPDWHSGNGPLCLCNDGHGGPHCEYAKGDVPNCDLDCQNGGHCVLGETTNAADIYHYWDTSENQGDQKHCRCPEGYDGPLCEHRKTECGDGHCFNGSQCVEKTGTDGKSHFHCDCTAANTDDAKYAGRFCQYKATSVCSTSQQHDTALFCVNNGRCKEDVYEGCDCNAPYTGFSCEFRIPAGDSTSAEPPSTATSSNTPQPIGGIGPAPGPSTNSPPATNPAQLTTTSSSSSDPDSQTHHTANDDPDYAKCNTQCQNNGICRKGAKDIGALEEISHDIGYLNQTSNRDFEHCVCPKGFTGVHCETLIEVCGEGMHLCLHGSKCVTDGDYHACDCSTAENDGAEVFAGRSCEHKATNICTKGDLGPGKPLSFCTNSGTCKTLVSPEESHAGCDCPTGFAGPHCELRTAEGQPEPSNNFPVNNNNSSAGKNDDSEGGLLIVEIIVLMLSLVLLATVILYGLSRYIQSKKNQAANAESVSFMNNQEPYKDEPNISPHRDSVFDPFPRRHHTSSADPFVSVVEGDATRQASRAPAPLEPVEIC